MSDAPNKLAAGTLVRVRDDHRMVEDDGYLWIVLEVSSDNLGEWYWSKSIATGERYMFSGDNVTPYREQDDG